jgi:hypothetical protein
LVPAVFATAYCGHRFLLKVQTSVYKHKTNSAQATAYFIKKSTLTMERKPHF